MRNRCRSRIRKTAHRTYLKKKEKYEDDCGWRREIRTDLPVPVDTGDEMGYTQEQAAQ
jgi:hypothetical protein